MTSSFDLSDELVGSGGIVPVFPLPDVVHFPHLALPLHIFEQRYRDMVRDTLRGDRLIAMALLKPGWEKHYQGTPEFYPMVCVGRITAEEQLPSGRYNIVLQGLQRARVLEERTTRSYREIRVQLCPDRYPAETTIDRNFRHRELLVGFRRLFQSKPLDPLFQQVMESELPLGTLCDLLAGLLQISALDKQALLDEVDVDRRSALLLACIRQEQARCADTVGAGFPPQFSVN